MKSKTLIPLLLCLVQFFSGFSQFSLSADSFYLESNDMNIHIGPVMIYNETNEDKTMVWEKTVHCMSDWWIHYLTDNNGHYLGTTETYDFILPANDSTLLMVELFTFDSLPGVGVFQIDFFEQGIPDERQTCTFYWNTTDCTTSANENFTKTKPLKLFPNPVSDRLSLIGNEEGYLLEIYHTSGVLVLTKVLETQQTIDLSDWQTGYYFATIKDRRGTFVKSQKFIKY